MNIYAFNQHWFRTGHSMNAVIIWNMVVKSIPYRPPIMYEFLDQKRKRKVQEMKKLITKFNLTTNELGLTDCPL